MKLRFFILLRDVLRVVLGSSSRKPPERIGQTLGIAMASQGMQDQISNAMSTIEDVLGNLRWGGWGENTGFSMANFPWFNNLLLGSNIPNEHRTQSRQKHAGTLRRLQVTECESGKVDLEDPHNIAQVCQGPKIVDHDRPNERPFRWNKKFHEAGRNASLKAEGGWIFFLT